MHKPKLIFLSIMFALSSIFLLHYYVVGQAVYGDGIFYYGISHSIYFRGDLDITRELGHHYSHSSNNSSNEEPLEKTGVVTKTGLLSSKYPLGPSLSWLPAIFIADQGAGIFRKINESFPQNGYSDIYQITLGLLNIAFLSIGLYILFKLLTLNFSKSISTITILTLIFGSNLLFYGSIDVVNSHPLSFLISSFFVFYWFTNKKDSNKKWFLMGLIIGLLALTRTQDLIFLILPIFKISKSLFNRNTKIVVAIRKFSLVMLGTFISFSPQLIEWRIIFGNFFQNPYISSKEGFSILNWHILDLFFSPKIGIFIWTPIYILFIVGLYFLYKKKNNLFSPVFTLFLAQIILISIWSGWSQGEAFGVRMLVSTLPFLSIALATFIEKTLKSRILRYIPLLIITFNFAAIFYFLLFAQNPTFDRGKATQPQELKKIEKILRIKD